MYRLLANVLSRINPEKHINYPHCLRQGNWISKIHSLLPFHVSSSRYETQMCFFRYLHFIFCLLLKIPDTESSQSYLRWLPTALFYHCNRCRLIFYIQLKPLQFALRPMDICSFLTTYCEQLECIQTKRIFLLSGRDWVPLPYSLPQAT